MLVVLPKEPIQLRLKFLIRLGVPAGGTLSLKLALRKPSRHQSASDQQSMSTTPGAGPHSEPHIHWHTLVA